MPSLRADPTIGPFPERHDSLGRTGFGGRGVLR